MRGKCYERMAILMDKLSNLLAFEKKGDLTSGLNYFLLSNYRVEEAALNDKRLLLIYPRKNLDDIYSLQKHLENISNIYKLPTVLVIERLSALQRNELIKFNIQFIVKKKYFFLPDLGIVLSQKADAEANSVNKLTPSAQVIWFFLLYNNKACVASELGKKLHVTPMTLSRSVRQLESMDLLVTKKVGVDKLILLKENPKKAFSQSLKYLINPISRDEYVEVKKLPQVKVVSGYDALAVYSKMASGDYPCYAVSKAEYKNIDKQAINKFLYDPKRQAEVQIWKYDPWLLSVNGVADELSLFLTIQDSNDMRLKISKQEMMSNLWRRIK